MDKKEILERFLRDDKLTLIELNAVIGWIKDGSLDDVFNDKLDELKPIFDNQQTDWNSSVLKDQLFKKLGKSKKPTGRDRSVSFFSWRRHKRIGIAATIAAIFGIGLFLYKSELMVTTNQEPEVELINLVTKSNPSGIKTVIKLQDGSAVYLNAESSISYPVDFISDRTIELTGEAFFEVAQDHNSPFKVKTNGIETVALGTSFNVKFYEEFPLEIVLATGKVTVENPAGAENLKLLPGEGITYNRVSLAIEKFDADVKQSTYWKEGTLYLDKLDFNQLTKALERWYGVTITVKGTIPTDGNFSGIFPNNETLTNVMEAMKFAYPFEYELHGKKLLIDFNKT